LIRVRLAALTKSAALAKRDIPRKGEAPTIAGVVGSKTRYRVIACLSAAGRNPYLELLYRHLTSHGFELVEKADLALWWLWTHRHRVGFLHIHWPESLYRYGRGPTALRPVLSRAKLVLFVLRLWTARALGYRLVWTIHQVVPHESLWGLDRRAARLLARACTLLIAHDRSTASSAGSLLSVPTEIAVVPHGSYIGVYPEGRPRTAVRTELGLPEDSFVFLCFGELRAYKEIELLLEAFGSVRSERARLLVVGNPKSPTVGLAVSAASERDARIVSKLGFAPADRVAELYRASEAAVLPRGEDGTSGSLLLALSMGLPVVAADVATTRDLTDNGEAGWLFRPHDARSLKGALERALSDGDAPDRGRAAFDVAERLSWPEIAVEIARLLRRVA
jgi:glycosyltransferase involved in cell wall biosynthesis